MPIPTSVAFRATSNCHVNRYASVSVLFWLATTTLLGGQTSIPMAQYNNLRTNVNLDEHVLTTSNVNPKQFGKVFTRKLDGYSYALPLYMPSVQIPGRGPRNIVYVSTLHNTVSAFDAEDPAESKPYWSITLGRSIPFPPGEMLGYVQPEMGIMSTPAIDPSTGTLYVVATTQQGSNAALFLHALDIATGAEKFGGPALIRAQVSGSATGKDRNPDGTIVWNPNTRMQRAALLVTNQIVYIAFSAYGAFYTEHGWVMAYNASNVQEQIAVFMDTLNGQRGGIWQSGAGLATDPEGNVYLMSGDGTFNGTTDFADSFIKLGPHLELLDWFTPSNWKALFDNDLDLGAGGPILFPDSNLLVGGGKDGIVYLLDRSKLGHLEGAGSGAIQSFQATPPCTGVGKCMEIHSTALWNTSPDAVYYIWAWNDVLRGFRFHAGHFDTEPFSHSSVASAYPGGSLTVSADRDTAGTGIVWATTTKSSSLVNVVPGTLRAFDALNLSHELWNSDMNAKRDALGNLAKFAPPVVANGRVYVSTFSNQLDVYGLLPGSVDRSAEAIPAAHAAIR